MSYGRNLFRSGLAIAVLFWVLEAAIHTWVFGEGAGLAANLIPASANEWWMRSLAAFLLVAFGAYAHRVSLALSQGERERQAIQAQLDDALTRVLREYLPICAHCKAIREGELWVPLERYVTEHTKALFSHGLCSKCLPLYDDPA